MPSATAMNGSDTNPKTIGILGSGQMGVSAAVLFVRAGFNVCLWSRDESRLRDAQSTFDGIDAFLDQHLAPSPVRRGELVLEPRLDRVDDLSYAILECIAEDLAQKQSLLSQLVHCRERKTLVMSCTSGLSITQMAEGSRLEDSLVGAHFWNPPYLIPVVEVVSGDKTPTHQIDLACELLRRSDRIPIRCPDIPGFIGNRLMHAMWREALALVESGACTPQDIDQVVKWTFALRLPALGPMENMDLVGHTLVAQVQRYLLPDLANNIAPSNAIMSGLSNGRSGMKAGHGFYDWTQRDPHEAIALRDRQIVKQLQFLREQNAIGKFEPEPTV